MAGIAERDEVGRATVASAICVAVAQPLVGDGVRGDALVVPGAARARRAVAADRGAPETAGARDAIGGRGHA